ncbi:hypothetical protein [Altericroceibacterium xinjiangense]|uniref:hypothetical protein n=1 Tax=Altericroceibacterium xinjiangense TaxID=762261 RepID=UPI000F7DB528|nr:hypothetical protein [Altericroceibacterium xinjiangense]
MTGSIHPAPFFFGIPLIAREAARDWGQVNRLFDQTLHSLLAQTDADFRIVVAGHDAPAGWQALAANDARFHFLEADWPVAEPSGANDDGGMKKWLIREHVLEQGGGLLMYCDADDLVDRRTVEISRKLIGPGIIGGLVQDGFAIDHRSGHALPLPHPDAFDGPFHRLCGSSTVARLEPGQPVPHDRLGSHHEWDARAREIGETLAMLPLEGAYLVNSGENHSEHQGPFALWRRRFARTVAEQGRPLSAETRYRLGMEQAESADDAPLIAAGASS